MDLLQFILSVAVAEAFLHKQAWHAGKADKGWLYLKSLTCFYSVTNGGVKIGEREGCGGGCGGRQAVNGKASATGLFRAM